MDSLATSRLPTSSSPAYNTTSLAHEALDSDGYHTYFPESSHQQISTGEYLPPSIYSDLSIWTKCNEFCIYFCMYVFSQKYSTW